jgi:SOS response regulatory protein OraA/RecX
LLINKKYSKDNILKYLNSKGYNIMQIKNAIDSINEENINNYVELASSQGFNKQEIVSSLLKAGWKKEDILKCI